MTKFIILGDLHLRSKTPERRKDNIFETQLNKLSQVMNYAKKNNIEYIIQVGDVFDQSCPDREVLNQVTKLLYESRDKVEFIVVYGQHDLYMRSYKSLNRTGLDLLYQAGLVEIANERPIIFNDNIALYGMSYGEDFPQINFEQSEKINVLLSHEPVIIPKKLEKEKIFEGLVRKLNEKERKTKETFSLFINGDWHSPYYEENRRVINPGVMTRLSLVEKDIIPGFEVLEIKENGEFDCKRVDLKCKDFDEIFDTRDGYEVTEGKMEDRRSFREFLDGLRKGIKGEEGISFYDNVLKWLETEENEEIKGIVMEALKYAKEKGSG